MNFTVPTVSKCIKIGLRTGITILVSMECAFDSILAAYDKENDFRYYKAKFLLVICILFSLVLFLSIAGELFLVDTWKTDEVPKFYPVLLLVLIASLVLVRAGRMEIAANTMALAGCLAASAVFLSRPIYTAGVTMGVFMHLDLAFATLFCTPFFALMILLILVAVHSFYYFFIGVPSSTGFLLQIASNGFISGTSSLVYLFIIGIVASHYLKGALKTAEGRSQKLQESEEKYRHLVDEAGDIIYIVDSTGTIQFMNETAVRILKYDHEEMVGKKYWEFIHEPARLEVMKFYGRQLKKQIPQTQYEVPMITKQGEEVWLGQNVRYIINGDRIQSIHGIARDITERKKAEKDLEKKQKELQGMRLHLQDIIDSMPSILIGIDGNSLITELNLEASKYVGMNKVDSVGRHFIEVFPRFASLMKGMDMPQIAERVITEEDGQMKYWEAVMYPLSEGDDGGVVRIDDITLRVRMEELMVQTEKMMTVGGLATGMAHEINNPLGGILMSVQNLERRLTGDIPINVQTAAECGITMEQLKCYMEKRECNKMISGIVELGDRAAKIISNMLSFGRRSGAQRVLVNIIELIEKTIELASSDYNLKKKYDFRHITIVRDYSESIPEIYCIPIEIEQVLLNLFKNAAQAMYESEIRKGLPMITISIRWMWDKFNINVSDNGPGMDHETVKHIFEPFYTTKKTGEGTGLGLSVSYFIIKNTHKGDLKVESYPGRGTTFTIELPVFV